MVKFQKLTFKAENSLLDYENINNNTNIKWGEFDVKFRNICESHDLNEESR